MAKTFDELTIMDDYMFAQVMRNKKYLCPLLENILGMKIVDLKFVEPQKTEKEGYESKGVRLDIYVESEDGTIYDVEVQTTDKKLGDECQYVIDDCDSTDKLRVSGKPRYHVEAHDLEQKVDNKIEPRGSFGCIVPQGP